MTRRKIKSCKRSEKWLLGVFVLLAGALLIGLSAPEDGFSLSFETLSSGNMLTGAAIGLQSEIEEIVSSESISIVVQESNIVGVQEGSLIGTLGAGLGEGESPFLNSSSLGNQTDENLTVYYYEGAGNKTIVDWRVNGSSIAVLNMPFEGGSNSTYTKDYSSFENDGNVSGAIWNSTGGYDGKGAYDFDGISNYMTLGNDTSLSLTNDLTLSAWIYPRVIPATTPSDNIISKYNATGSNYVLGLRNTDEVFLLWENGGTNIWETTTSALSTEEWFYITLTRNGTNNPKIYINGNEQAGNCPTGDCSKSFLTNDQPLVLGRTNSYSSGNEFNGNIDEVLIFNRSLSPEQVLAIYNNRTDLIVSQETSLGENWSACVTPNDGTEDGVGVCSGSLTIIEYFDNSAPQLNFTNPTPPNGTTTTNTSTLINISILNANNLSTFIYNWNKTNYTFYNKDLLLMYNFDNLSVLGDTTIKAVDVSKYSHNGTITNAVYTPSGKCGGALSLDGSGDIVSIANTVNLYPRDKSFSFSTWIYYKETCSDDWCSLDNVISGKWCCGGDKHSGFFFLVGRYQNKNMVDVNFADGTNVVDVANYGGLFESNTWNHFSIVRDKEEGNVKLYLNGVKIANKTDPTGDIAGFYPSNNLFLGQDSAGGNQFNGLIDELKIFNKSLSDAEVYEIYTSNLNKYDTDKWNFYINQSKNATTGLDVGNYTYQAFATNINENVNQTEVRLFNVVAANNVPNTILVILNSTSINNYTTDDLTCYANITDADGGNVYANYTWYNNSVEVVSLRGQSVAFTSGTLQNIANLSFGNTTAGENWTCSVMAYDGTDHESDWNNASLVIANSATVLSNLVVNSTLGTNTSSENLTAYWSATDADSDAIKNITNWYVNGSSIAVLNMPFEGGSNSTYTKDYSSVENDGTVNGATWNSTGGYDGKGAYEFDGNDYINVTGTGDQDPDQLTISTWIKMDALTATGVIYGHRSEATRLIQLTAQNSTDIRFQLRSSGNSIKQIINTSFDLTEWHHVVGVFDNINNYHALYVDGQLSGTDTTDFGAETFTSTIQAVGVTFAPTESSYFNGTIDDVQIFNRSLSPEQIQALYNNRTDLIVSQETSLGENWSACVTPNDGSEDGVEVCSSNLTIVAEANIVPVVSNLFLNSTLGTNLSTENITAYWSATDANNDSIKNITDWRREGESIAVLNLPFEADGNLNGLDYSTYENNVVTVGSGIVWNPSGGVDGFGAYDFSGTSGSLTILDADSLDVASNLTIMSWVKFSESAANQPNYATIANKEVWPSNGWTFGFRTDVATNSVFFRFDGTPDCIVDWTDQGTYFDDLAWHFVVATYNGSRIDLYVDDVLKVSDTSCTNINPGNSNNIIFGYALNGSLDEFKLFDEALSTTQLSALYQNRTDLIVSQETSLEENWSACVTPNDGTEDGVEVCSSNLTILASETYDLSISAENISYTSGTIKETDTIEVNASVYNLGSTNITYANITLYQDNIYNQSTLTNVSNGSYSLVQFNVTPIGGNHTFTFVADPLNSINEANESNNNFSFNIFVKYVAVLSYFSPLNGTEVIRGKDTSTLPHEDSEHLIDNNISIIARVYDLYNDSHVLSANCSFYLNSSLLGKSLTNSSTGNCSYSLDKTIYDPAQYNITVNFTDLTSEAVQHTSQLENTSIINLTKVLIDLDPLNRIDNRYMTGEASVLNITITKNDLPYSPDSFVVDLKNTGDGLLQTASYPGDITLEDVGNYLVHFILADNSDIHWVVYVNDSGERIATASHSDVEVINADGIANITVLNSSGGTFSTTFITLSDNTGYALNSTTAGVLNWSVRKNKNHSVDILAATGEKLILNNVYFNDTNNTLVPQIVQNYSGGLPSNISDITSIVAFQTMPYEFESANITLPKDGKNITVIVRCPEWNQTTNNCTGNWETFLDSFESNSTHIWFNVTSFSGYAGGDGYDSALTIWDQNDTGMPYANLTALVDNEIFFYANYTNYSSGEIITGAECNISFNVSPNGPFSMDYNETKLLYEYNRSFSAAQEVSWNVTCINDSFDTLVANDTIVIVAAANNVPDTISVILNSTSINNYTTDDLTCYANITDADGGNVYANYTWYKDGVENLTGQSVAFTSGTLQNIANLSFGNTTAGENWTCSVMAYDGTDYETDWNNASLVIEEMLSETSYFIFQINTTESPQNFSFQTDDALNLFVNWGDGNNNTYNGTDLRIHEYATADIYNVSLNGNASRISYYEGTPTLLVDILTNVSEGIGGITSAYMMFRNTNVVNFTAESFFDGVSGEVTNMGYMFYNSTFNQNINNWDVSKVTDMALMFTLSQFNQSINDWDVSNVTTMVTMFKDSQFNQNISNWNVSKVTTMYWMFYNSQFNQNISGWNVSNVITMNGMFRNAQFNQSLGNWDVSNVTDLDWMFASSSFNQNISDWDVSAVTSMYRMFWDTSFNQNISGWDVSSVDDMGWMFTSSSFNQDISGWNVSNVRDMSRMFYNSPFNQSINNWDVSSVTSMSDMFGYSDFNQNISGWDVFNVTDMSYLFSASQFNQDISGWNVSNVDDMNGLFYNSPFNQSINNWDVSSVTSMSGMFGYSDFNQDISNWDISSVTDMTSMFTGVTLSTANYNSLLNGWASLFLQNNVTFDAGSSMYSSEGLSARNDTLIGVYNWTITDGGKIDESPLVTLVSPEDNYINGSFAITEINFSCNATDDIQLQNISLYITNSTNESFTLNQTTNIVGTTNSTSWTLNLTTGNYTWNCLAYDNSSFTDWDVNRTILLNYSSPLATYCNGNYTSGDWNITSDLSCGNETINVTGILTVDSGAVFTLGNITLKPGANININNGTLNVYDSNITFQLTGNGSANMTFATNTFINIDNSILTSNNSNTGWGWVINTENFNITNNNVSYSGTGETIGPDFNLYGLNNVNGLIYNNRFTNDVYAYHYCFTMSGCNSGVNISSNYFDSWVGISYSNSFTMENNILDSGFQFTDSNNANVTNNTFGDIYITNSDGTSPSSNLTLRNNIFSNLIDNNASNLNVMIYSNNYGEIKWENKGNLSISAPLGIGTNLYLENNTLGLADNSLLSNLNTSAQLTFYGLGYGSTPQLLKNGIRCDNSSLCNVSYSTGTLYANVSSFSNYTTQETPDSSPTVTLVNPAVNYINDSATITEINFSCNATDDIQLQNISLYITNSTNESFTLNQTTNITGTTNSTSWSLNLTAGNYTWNCLAYDNALQSDWDTNRTILLNYTAPGVDTYPNWSNNATSVVTTYSSTTESSFNITWTDDTSISTVYFESNYSGAATNYSMNNINAFIYNYSTILPAGTYYWKSYANDSANQWNVTDEWHFTIAQNTENCDVEFNATSPITYPTLFNVSTNCTSDFILYRNGSIISNNSEQFLSAGSYNFTVLRTDQSNYSNYYDEETFTINPANSEVNITLNNSESNLTIEESTVIDLNCTLITGEGLIYLYNNGTLINSGTSSIGNSTTFSSEGMYNITCLYSSTQNYSYSSETYWINVTKDYPVVQLSTPAANYRELSGTIVNVTFECNVTDIVNLENISLYITNGSNENFALNQSTNISGTSNSSNWTLEIEVGSFTWNCLAYNNNSENNWASANRTISPRTATEVIPPTTSSPGGSSGGGGGIILVVNESEDVETEDVKEKQSESITEEPIVEEKLPDNLPLTGGAIALIPESNHYWLYIVSFVLFILLILVIIKIINLINKRRKVRKKFTFEGPAVKEKTIEPIKKLVKKPVVIKSTKVPKVQEKDPSLEDEYQIVNKRLLQLEEDANRPIIKKEIKKKLKIDRYGIKELILQRKLRTVDSRLHGYPSRKPIVLKASGENINLGKELVAVEKELIQPGKRIPRNIKIITKIPPRTRSYGKKLLDHELNKVTSLLANSNKNPNLLLRKIFPKKKVKSVEQLAVESKAKEEVIRISKKIEGKNPLPKNELQEIEEKLTKLRQKLER